VLNLAWQLAHVIPALQRLRQENFQFEANLELYSKFRVSLGYIENPCLKTKQNYPVC
jgi:hypothetical protein